MKVLVFSVSAGGGHKKAAQTIKSYLEEQGDTVLHVDAFEYINPVLNKTVGESYSQMAKKAPNLWKFLYNSTNNEFMTKAISGFVGMISGEFMPILNDFNPDIIITTHAFINEILIKLKKDDKINIPIVCLITDYAPHSMWLNELTDAYIIANDDMIKPMIEEGIKRERIHSYGIPVEEKFLKNDKSKKEILKNLNLDSNIPMILIMAGAFGFGGVAKIYKKLAKIKKNFQIVVITGKNRRLFLRMKNLLNEGVAHVNPISKEISKFKSKMKHEWPTKIKPTRVIYFTNEVDKYMHAADFIITKPGGLTISEALACNLPIVTANEIPGQEEENAEFLLKNNMAVRLEKKSRNAEVVRELLEDEKKLKTLSENCKNFDKSQCLEKTYELLKKLASKE